MEKSKVEEVVPLSKGPGKLTPASMSLFGPASKRIVVSAARRSISTHDEVMEALARHG